MTASTGPTDRLVGRQRELTLLHRLLADARAGAGRLVVVTGPAGIGKTRLIEQLVAEAGTTTCWGAAIADAGMPALWPWLRAMRGLPGPFAAVTALADGAAQRGHFSADESAAVTFAADTATLDALAAQAATDPGLVVVLDDLQWADQATLRLLERVTAEIRRLPMLVVGGYRDAGTTALPEPMSHRATDVIGLGPLSTTESAAVLTGSVADADHAAVRRAAELSGGSPLYLRTLARVATDQLRGQATWDSAVGGRPELRHLVTVAMRAAGPEATELVGALSVLGHETEPELLAGLVDTDSSSAVVERLQPAVPAGLIELPADGPIRFAHALVRDASYALLRPARRTALHRKAAELLEPRAVAGDHWAGIVASHWQQAGAPGSAATWSVRAADAAAAAGSYDEAARHLRYAIDAVARHEFEADRGELLLDLARVQYLGGHLQQSAQTCVQAADDGERTGRPEVICRAAITVQGISHPEIVHLLQDLCRRALAGLGPDTSATLRARVEAQLSCALHELGDHDEALRWSSAALKDAVNRGDVNSELDAIRARATLKWGPGFDAEMIALGRRALELADAGSRPLARLWAHVWCSDAAIHVGDMPAAWQEVDAIRSLADRTGLPLVRWHLLRREAALACLTGDFNRWRELADQAAQVAADWDDMTVNYTAFGQSTMLALLRDDPDELTPGWTRMLPMASGFPPVAKAGLALALTLVDRRDEAETLYRAALPVVADLDHGLDAATICFLAEVAPALGDADGCHLLRDVITRDFADTVVMGNGTVFYLGSVARLLAELALACDDTDDAIPLFERGLVVDERIGARPFLARGRFGLARALHVSGQHARAAELAKGAAAQARQLDMPGLLRAADDFLAGLIADHRAADPLTAREHEVVELVARALSNRDIAARLVLSERTVESHVRRILAKTGLRTRTELTRWFLQRH